MAFLQTGLGASVFSGGYGSASVPTAAGVSASGPTSIGQQAFGIVGGGPGASSVPFWASLAGGALALGLLGFIWYSLPR
jgi:hypothetical protein